MTSAAPARKPYRKAPPQHRETRNSLPVFREDVNEGTLPAGGPATLTDPSQVNRFPKHTSIFQRMHFTENRPEYPDSPEGQDDNVFSSSWSIRSDSDLDVSSLSSLDLTALPPPRIFSHGAIAVGVTANQRPKDRQFMNRFLSRSEVLLALSGDPLSSEGSQRESRTSSPARSSRSFERSLVFKEKAEILAPRRESLQPYQIPSLPPQSLCHTTLFYFPSAITV